MGWQARIELSEGLLNTVNDFKNLNDHRYESKELQDILEAQRPQALRTVFTVRSKITKSSQVLKCRK